MPDNIGSSADMQAPQKSDTMSTRSLSTSPKASLGKQPFSIVLVIGHTKVTATCDQNNDTESSPTVVSRVTKRLRVMGQAKGKGRGLEHVSGEEGKGTERGTVKTNA